jgi:hypothetical protein
MNASYNNATKRLLALLTSAAFAVIATSSQATLILYEPFNYTEGQGLAGQDAQTFLAGTTGGPSGTGRFWGQQAPNGNYWMSCGISGTYAASTDALVAANDLTVTGLGKASGTKSVSFGGQGITSRLAFTPINAALDGSPVTAYYSFAFMIPSGGLASTAASGGLVAGFNNTRGSQSGNPSTVGGAMCVKASGAGFVVGVNEDSVNSSAATYDSTVLSFDTTYFVVGKYTINGTLNLSTQDDDFKMWINPSSGTFGGADPAGGLVALAQQNDIPTNAGDGNAVVQTFLLRQDGTSSAGNAATSIIFDELRVGTTYADVTPTAVPEPAALSILALGAAALLARRLRGMPATLR